MARGAVKIKVKEYFPQDPKDMEYIIEQNTRWVIDRYKEQYSDEILDVVLPIFDKIQKLKDTGLNYEDSKAIVLKNYSKAQGF